MIFDRHPANPIVTRDSIPAESPLADPSSVFNPGAIYHKGRFRLVLRVQTRARRTVWMTAASSDGMNFSISPRPAEFVGLDAVDATIHHIYDPRITLIEGRLLVVAAMDVDQDCRLGLFETEDLQQFSFLGFCSPAGNRNGVLFPQTVGGLYLRLDRPNRVHRSDRPPTGDAIVLSASDNLIDWEQRSVIAQGRPRLWDEMIGPGPPPILTRHGWLVLYHGVATHPGATNIYQAGLILLDAEDPSRVLARSDANVLEPREPYETIGQVPNVVFPSGWIVQPDAAVADDPVPDEAKLYVYYGAADTSVALATTTVSRLVESCR
jgi:beta-1,4-mannooligosaccharide/beta-1,4-mannosyl-N-acetylglucosamine phosphorylase